MRDVECAKARLLTGTDTCVLCRADSRLTSQARGVAPMLDWMAQGMDLRGYSAADRVVGKAAAMLFVLAGVTAVYAVLISQPARDVLCAHGIPVEYDRCTPGIRNRTRTGPCPMEAAVAGIDDPSAAHRAILQTRQRLQNEKEQTE